MTTADPARPFDRTPPAELTPVERAAVAALQAPGLLRRLHPAAFPPPAGATNSQENPVDSTRCVADRERKIVNSPASSVTTARPPRRHGGAI